MYMICTIVYNGSLYTTYTTLYTACTIVYNDSMPVHSPFLLKLLIKYMSTALCS